MVSLVESELELKSPADVFFKRLSQELHHALDAVDNFHDIEVHEGDFKTHGSVKSWSYTIDGKKEIFKEKFEIDEPNTTVSFVAVGGHVLEQYKSYKLIEKVIPNADKPGIVKIQIEYEKFKETDPEPTNYLQLIVGATTDIDAHLVGAGK